jgi:hypothetical protein
MIMINGYGICDKFVCTIVVVVVNFFTTRNVVIYVVIFSTFWCNELYYEEKLCVIIYW